MNQVEDSSSQKMYVYNILHMNEFMLIYFKSLWSRYWYDDTYMCCLPSVLTVRVSDPPYLEFPETSLQFVFSVHCICCICFVVASWVNLKTPIFPLVNSSSKRWCDLWYDLKRPKEDKWHFPVFLRISIQSMAASERRSCSLETHGGDPQPSSTPVWAVYLWKQRGVKPRVVKWVMTQQWTRDTITILFPISCSTQSSVLLIFWGSLMEETSWDSKKRNIATLFMQW